MQTTLIVSFVGDDRPGLVGVLSDLISSCGGNWLESRLAQLAGNFAGLIRVSVPAAAADDLRLALEGLAASGIRASVMPCAGPAPAPARPKLVTLTVLGPDRPGIVREVSAALAARDINVLDMQSHVAPAPMSAEPMFHARVQAEAPAPDNLDDLADDLDVLADQMDVEIQLESRDAERERRGAG